MERSLFEIEPRPLCRNYGLGVIPYSPLAGGFLTGKYRRGASVESVRATDIGKKYGHDRGFALIEQLDVIGRTHDKTVAQTALAWLLTNPVVTAPIIGANTAAQLADSLGAAGYRLTAEEMKSLNDLTSYPMNWRNVWD
jgi:aryl-alcohol dehydrogenase-like predicted oxidoreductase